MKRAMLLLFVLSAVCRLLTLTAAAAEPPYPPSDANAAPTTSQESQQRVKPPRRNRNPDNASNTGRIPMYRLGVQDPLSAGIAFIQRWWTGKGRPPKFGQNNSAQRHGPTLKR